ncbi:MAG: aspartate dehydrogenase [Candidatus Omnitrophica bacterium]|nr:aspartate dehydrogenase [Candidatus Omnitrophota bacterium]
MKKRIKIGLVGCGTIGSEIALAIDKMPAESAVLAAISDKDIKKAEALLGRLRARPEILGADELIKKADLIVEAASMEVSGPLVKKAVEAKKDIMIMSVGGIVKDYPALFALAEQNGCRIYLPSGAICGLDGVKASALGKIKKAELTTRKPPAALSGAPFIERNKIDLKAIRSETVIFQGSALEAIKGFPANINVACALSIAGIGPEKTLVRIIASPEYKGNTHEIVIEAESGRLATRAENVPSPGNPKTSYLAVLSAIATLKQILGTVKVGT